MKPTLSICRIDLKDPYTSTTLGLVEFITFLIESNQFDVSYHNEKISTPKQERSTLLYYNGKKIFLDFWDYAMPTHTTNVFKSDVNLIIKLQHPKMTFEDFNRRCESKKMYSYATMEQKQIFFNKITPWTFFCSRMMKKFIGKEDTIEQIPIQQIAFFCGKTWKCRRYFLDKLKSEGIEYINSDQGGANLYKGRPSVGKVLSDEEYLNKMKSSKYGLVLHGRGSVVSESKNRREIDYMMLKKPLLLNYRPNYYNPLIEGKHYIYIDSNTDFKKIESMYNIDDIAKNGYEWYQNNASEKGVVNTFLQIMNERRFNENC